MAAAHSGDPATLAGVLRRQRAYLLGELRGLAAARTQGPSAVVSLLITAAELHIRADLGVVDAAEQALGPGRPAVGQAGSLPFSPARKPRFPVTGRPPGDG
jgi:hypothetical protein